MIGTVYSSNGTSTDSVSVAQLQANPGQCPTYQGQSMNELGRQGPVDVPLAQNATWSLPTILGCLQTPISPGRVTGVTVIDADGNPEEGSDSQLTPQDLQTPSDFNNTSEYPVVQALGSVNQYDRPWRGSPQGQPDDDYLDEVQSNQPISIEVFTGGRLTVTASASKTTVATGGAVSFGATVGAANGSPLSYTWSFDGGAPNSTAPAPKAAFNAAGQYNVAVQVTDAAGAGGGAEIPITVGSRPPVATGSHHQTGAGTNRKSHSPTGPRKSSGQHAGAGAGSTRRPSRRPEGRATPPQPPYRVHEPDLDHGEHPATQTSTPTHTTTTRSLAPHPPRHTSPDQAAHSRLPLRAARHRAADQRRDAVARASQPARAQPPGSRDVGATRAAGVRTSLYPPWRRRSGSSCCWVSAPGASSGAAAAGARCASQRDPDFLSDAPWFFAFRIEQQRHRPGDLPRR